jgi:hypothetical protein
LALEFLALEFLVEPFDVGKHVLEAVLASGIEIVPGRERKPRRNGAYCERDNAPSAFWIGAAV